MHYTSISNILKVINPLFLDDLSQKIDDDENDEIKVDIGPSVENGGKKKQVRFKKV